MIRTRTPRSPLEKLADRISAGREITADLATISSQAPMAYRAELRALTARIRLCNSPENSWYAPNATANTSDQTYEAIGRFWRCESKLCPDCLARQARASRKRLRAALTAQELRKGERFYFTTFTIPNTGLSLVESRSIVNYAWSLFRKRKLCVSLIRGGSKTEEFTVTKHGFHYHLHCLWLSQYIMFQEVRRVWTECVEASFMQHDRKFHVDTKDGLLIVKVKTVKPDERIVQEVCKYITKSDSWSKLPMKDLIEVATIRKWHRMFELFGSFRSLVASDVEAAETIVHTSSSSDGRSGTSPSYWRDKIVEQSFEDYYSDLCEEYERCINGRRRQLELRWRDSPILTYAEILAKEGPS